MVRAFLALAGSNLLILVGTMVLGYLVKDARSTNMHVALAVFAAVLTCLVHVITLMFTVIIGKLTRQAVELGNLDRAPRRKLDRLKVGVAIGLAVGMVSVVVAVATGATTLRSPMWRTVHQVAAWLAIIANGVVFYLALGRVHDASKISDQAFEEYNRKRRPSAQEPIAPSEITPQRL